MRRHLQVGKPLELNGPDHGHEVKGKPVRQPSLAVALTTVMIAPFLMIIGTIGLDFLPKTGVVTEIFQAIGNPVITLGLALIYAMIFLGRAAGFSNEGILTISKKSIVPIVGLLLIIGGGGGLKNVLTAIGLSDIISSLANDWSIPPLVICMACGCCFSYCAGFRDCCGIRIRRNCGGPAGSTSRHECSPACAIHHNRCNDFFTCQ